MFFTNVSALKGELPNEMINVQPTPRTFAQGKWEVGDQFKYSWVLTEELLHQSRPEGRTYGKSGG